MEIEISACIVYPVSCILYPVSCILYPVSCILYPVSRIMRDYAILPMYVHVVTTAAQVPAYQPERAFALFEMYLNGSLFTTVPIAPVPPMDDEWVAEVKERLGECPAAAAAAAAVHLLIGSLLSPSSTAAIAACSRPFS
jgi:hypothetical protein